jgi:hypothetical protein
MTNSKYVSNKLFANPSFISGFSSVLDIGNTLQEYNTSKTEAEADKKALQNDWRAVGEDIIFSILRYEKENGKTAK